MPVTLNHANTKSQTKKHLECLGLCSLKTTINNSFLKPYLRLPELYFLIAAKAVDLVADVIAQVAEVVFVSAKIEQVEDRTRRRLHHNFARVAVCGHHLRPHLLAER